MVALGGWAVSYERGTPVAIPSLLLQIAKNCQEAQRSLPVSGGVSLRLRAWAIRVWTFSCLNEVAPV